MKINKIIWGIFTKEEIVLNEWLRKMLEMIEPPFFLREDYLKDLIYLEYETI